MAREVHAPVSVRLLAVFWGVQRILPKFGGWLVPFAVGEVVAPGVIDLSVRVAVRVLRLLLAL
ncbi:MAG: hypothetical protein ACUVRE_06235 [Thermoanaerobaculaceae bacterium]